MQENDSYGKVIYFELFGENCMKIITTGQFFLTNYKLSSFLKQPGKFELIFPPWNAKYKLKFQLS
jgi:hypothetical protein